MDPYALLGVSADADLSEIRKAYHELSTKYLAEQRDASSDREAAHAAKMLDVLEEAYNSILGRQLEPVAEEEALKAAHSMPVRNVSDSSDDDALQEYILLRGGLPRSNPVLLVVSCIIGLSTASVAVSFNVPKFGFWGGLLLSLLYMYIAMGAPWGFRAASNRFVTAWGSWTFVFFVYIFEAIIGVAIGLFAFPADVFQEYQYARIVDECQGRHKRLLVQLCLLIPVAYLLLMSIASAAGALGGTTSKREVLPETAAITTTVPSIFPSDSTVSEETLPATSPDIVPTPTGASETPQVSQVSEMPAIALGPQGESFSLTQAQSEALARGVALPLLTHRNWQNYASPESYVM